MTNNSNTNMLAINYSSSDEEVEDSNTAIDSSEVDGSVSRMVDINSKTESIVNPFDANNYDLSSSEDDIEEKESKVVVQTLKSIQTFDVSTSNSIERQIGSSGDHSIQGKVSIFSNPFKEEEKKQLSQLERHVKLTDNKTMSGNLEKKSQTICWSYHKHKKCRFGSRCRFRHNDTDFIDTKTIKRSNNSDKARVGITDSLIPPKRAIKAYYRQQNI